MAARATLTRRPACEADVPFLLILRSQTMDAHHAAMGIAQTPDEQEARVRSRFDAAEILERGGKRIGVWKVLREPGAWTLLQIQIAPSHQGQGLGGELISALIGEALATGVSLSLSVLKRNPARRLYERLGFEIVGEDELGFNMRLAAR